MRLGDNASVGVVFFDVSAIVGMGFFGSVGLTEQRN